MEESSEKRKERLQAMRMEASNQSQSHSSSSSTHSLSNLLIDPVANERTPQAPRFDFYTNPMAAFSDSNRRNPSAGGGTGPYYSPKTFSSPIRSLSPLPYPSSPSAGPRNSHDAATHSPHGLQHQTSQLPDQSQWRSPIQFQSPFSGHNGGTPPSYTPYGNSWNRSGGSSPSHGFPPNYSSRGGLPSPNFIHGSSYSPHSNSRRGGGWQFRGSSSSPRPGRSIGRGGRGHGFYHNRCSARHDPQHLYKTMVKDPWRKLKPVVGNILIPSSGSGTWLPKSITAPPKRAKVVEYGAKSQLSLAESLALSLEEAVDDV